MPPKHILKAGKYYVGDPCYAVAWENWGKLLDTTGCMGIDLNEDATNWNDGLFEYKGAQCFCGGTKYGDGLYHDSEGREYGVDAGLIGIIPLSVCDGNSMHGGNIISFEYDFEVWAENGVFNFDEILINTCDDAEIDEEEEDWP
jgi:hypothetical protein